MTEENQEDAAARWHRLLRYYGACIALENAGEAALHSSSQGKDFLPAPPQGQEWVASGREKLELGRQDDKADAFLRGPRWSNAPVSYFYGFPSHIKQTGRDGAERLIQPILIFDAAPAEEENSCAFVLQTGRPRINSAFLADKTLLTSVEERRQVTEALLGAWDEEKSARENLAMILRPLAKLLPPSALFSKNILSGGTEALSDRTGILPVGVVFKGVESKYTAGLEQELDKLREGGAPNRVLRLVINRDAAVKEDDGDGELLEITPLNDEQRSAVRSAFNNTMTLVTGPPGTGKSQVVLNIIANALLHGDSVLFSSKNHKAVDVVVNRLLQLQSEPLIIKYGANEREVEFAESFLSAVERAAGQDRQQLERETRECRERLAAVRTEERNAQQVLDRTVKRRNRIRRIDAALEALVASLPPALAANLDPYRRVEAGRGFYKSLAALSRLVKKIDKGPGPAARLAALLGFTLERRAMKAAAALLAAAPVAGVALTLRSLHDCRELLAIGRTLEQWMELQAQLLEAVRRNENETPMEVLRERIAAARERVVSSSIFYVDALMRRRLKSLDAKQRRNIADYVSVARRLDRDVAGGALAEQLRVERGRMFAGVVKAFPAMAVTNLSVRRTLPLEADAVDIVIIDEASQCDIASALPLLYRARRAVVVGDPNQLTHISLLHQADDQQLQQQAGLTTTDDQRFLYTINSLFDVGRGIVGSGAKFVHLLEHYRSRAEIINFSNRAFYGGKLSVWTDYQALRDAGHPRALAWHDVAGEVERPPSGGAYNIPEAAAVAALIERIAANIAARNDGRPVSLGVVTPFREQANRIRRLVEQKAGAAQLRPLDFIVDTAHKYQGDERDVMLFSPVVSRNARRGQLQFLSNTANLFNVALTRARAELHVVGDRQACAQSGVSYLADFVRYVEELEEDQAGKNGGGFESPWEEALHKALAQVGVNAVPQYSFQQYRLDLAIPDATPPLAIEVDGETWHRDLDGGCLRSDLRRDQHLARHGWRVKRFWVYQLKNDLPRCAAEIKEMLRPR